MNKSGPVVIIEKDLDEQDTYLDVFLDLKLPNKVLFFDDGFKAFNYLENYPAQPFIIISALALPKLNGLELREKVHNNEQLRLKCIPYIFFTTAVEQRDVIEAYSKSVQGFFIKPSTYEGLKTMVGNIVEYWKDCQSPNVF